MTTHPDIRRMIRSVLPDLIDRSPAGARGKFTTEDLRLTLNESFGLELSPEHHKDLDHILTEHFNDVVKPIGFGVDMLWQRGAWQKPASRRIPG